MADDNAAPAAGDGATAAGKRKAEEPGGEAAAKAAKSDAVAGAVSAAADAQMAPAAPQMAQPSAATGTADAQWAPDVAAFLAPIPAAVRARLEALVAAKQARRARQTPSQLVPGLPAARHVARRAPRHRRRRVACA